MDMPKPGDAHKKLAALVGEWTGDETLHPSPWDPSGGGASAQVTNRWVADGFAVVQEYEQIRDGKVTFRGHGVFWYDATGDEYVMHWWDSMGGPVNEYRGRLEGDRLELRRSMPQGGQSRTSWILTGPDGHDFLMEFSQDGETWQRAMEGQYARKAAASSPARRGAKPAKKAASAGKAKTRAIGARTTKARPAAKAARPAPRKATTKKPATKKATMKKAARPAAKKAKAARARRR